MTARRTALVTGGTGFIGSHCCVDLLQNGFDVVIVDSLINSTMAVLEPIRRLGSGNVTFYQADMTKRAELEVVFRNHRIDVVVHFAAHKAVGDSMNRPLEYYTNNVVGTIELLNVMNRAGVTNLVYSSSCSIYGTTDGHPLTESSPARPTNPYARGKLMCEEILQDLCARHAEWSVTALRYFNPVGAHHSGDLGEDPVGPPHNVVPFMAQLAVGRHDHLNVFGADYPTPDGTAIRDYIHVMDVVEGHRLALEPSPSPGFRLYNLGTGVGTSVFELVREFGVVSGRDIPYRVVDRRPGDVPELIASYDLARRELGWEPRRFLSQMLKDSWLFQQRHPNGYHVVVQGDTSTRHSAVTAVTSGL